MGTNGGTCPAFSARQGPQVPGKGGRAASLRLPGFDRNGRQAPQRLMGVFRQLSLEEDGELAVSGAHGHLELPGAETPLHHIPAIDDPALLDGKLTFFVHDLWTVSVTCIVK